MKKYSDLAKRASAAAKLRRETSSDLLSAIALDAVADGGKVAESRGAENTHLQQENKACEPASKSSCPVDLSTPTSPHRHLIHTPAFQHLIQSAKAQRKRQETKAQTLAARSSVPHTPWRRATSAEKFRYAGHCAEKAGGVALSLHLSAEIQVRLQAHSDPLRAFTDTLNRELKARSLLGIPYAMTLESSASGRLHVHGVAVVGQDDHTSLAAALRASGGLIEGKAASRQLTLRSLSNGAGWAAYCEKHLGQTDEVLNGRARLFLNRHMTRMARNFSTLIG